MPNTVMLGVAVAIPQPHAAVLTNWRGPGGEPAGKPRRSREEGACQGDDHCAQDRDGAEAGREEDRNRAQVMK